MMLVEVKYQYLSVFLVMVCLLDCAAANEKFSFSSEDSIACLGMMEL